MDTAISRFSRPDTFRRTPVMTVCSIVADLHERVDRSLRHSRAGRHGQPGTVYRARDTKCRPHGRGAPAQGVIPDPLRRSRALDLIRPYTAISHPHVATLFEAGEQRGSIYLVHEFVPGDTLATLVGGRPMNIRRAVDLATQVADALAEAHSLGLAHGALNAATRRRHDEGPCESPRLRAHRMDA